MYYVELGNEKTKMLIEKTYKIRRAHTCAETAEMTIPGDWRKFHNVAIGDTCKLLADGVIIVLPPNTSAEKEADVRQFLEGYKCRK